MQEAIIIKTQTSIGTMTGQEYITFEVILGFKNGNSFFEYAKNAAAVVESNQVSAQVVKRDLSGLAWIDDNIDGIRQKNEQLLSNVSVKLYSTTRSPYDRSIDKSTVEINGTTLYPVYYVYGTKLKSKQTDSGGSYQFDNLPLGTYYVYFEDIDKYQVTGIKQGNDMALDSERRKNPE